MFKYFGSKRRLAPTYQPPRYDTIVEPFAGAAGYAMHWLLERSDLRAVLRDTDPLVVAMWETLLAMEPDDLWNYPNPTEGTRSSDPIYLAATVSSGSWTRASRGDDFAVTEWMARDFDYTKRRMAHELARISGRVEIALGDYSDVPDIEATWFVDPPYQTEGRHYASNNQGFDYQTLAAWCTSRRGQIIVCEAAGAGWMPFTPHRMNQTVHRNTTGRQVEVVWYSDPEPTLFTA